MNSLEVIQSIIANHKLQNHTFHLVPHQALINWRQKYTTTQKKIDHISENKILEPIKTFSVKGSELSELGQQDLGKYTNRDNELVSISSEVRSSSGKISHLPMMNLHLDEYLSLPQLAVALSDICDQRRIWLVKTDRYYHVYGDFLLEENEWEDWNIRFLLAVILVSPRYIGYSFLRRCNLLRLNKGKVIKKKVPTVFTTIEQSTLGNLVQRQKASKRVMNVIELIEMKHSGQKRKSGEPYISHLEETAKLAVEITTDLQKMGIKIGASSTLEDIYITGYLHDIIEDTSTNYEALVKVASEKVANWVSVLTGDKRLDKSVRLALYHLHLSTSCLEIRIVKLADILSNIRSIRGSEDRQWLLDWFDKTEANIGQLGEEFSNSWAIAEARDTIATLRYELTSKSAGLS